MTYLEKSLKEFNELTKLENFSKAKTTKIVKLINEDAVEAEQGFMRVGDFVDQCISLARV